MEVSSRKVPKLNIIISPNGLERVSILGGLEQTFEAMTFYRTIAGDVLKIDEKIRKLAKTKRNS